MDKQELVNAVIEEMKKDINIHNDWTAIDAFLYNVDTKLLQGFLPEEDSAEENDKERHLFTPADAWQERCDSDPDWETKEIAEAKRLSREILLELITTRKENDNE